MAISYISSASAAGNTVAMPAHAAGDMIIGFGYRDGVATAPTMPADWLAWPTTPTGSGNTQAGRLAFKFAKSSSETTGTWSNATGVVVMVYRGATRAGAVAWGTGTGTTLTYPALTRSVTTGTSWGIRCAGSRSSTNLTTNAPSTVPNTARTGVATEARGLDSNGALGSNPTSGTQAITSTTGWEAVTAELICDTDLPATDIYVADTLNSLVKKLTAAGVHSTVAFTGLNAPNDVAVDSAGNVYVSDTGNDRVKKMTPGGTESTLAFTGIDAPRGLVIDSAASVYVSSTNTNAVKKLTSGGTESTLAFTSLSSPRGLAVDSAGSVYVATGTIVKKLTSGGTESTLAFTGLTAPRAVTVDSAGSVYVTNANIVKKLTSGGTESTLAFTGLSSALGIAVDSAGNMYATSSTTNTIKELASGGAETTLAFAGLNGPGGIAALLVADPLSSFTEDFSGTLAKWGTTTGWSATGGQGITTANTMASLWAATNYDLTDSYILWKNNVETLTGSSNQLRGGFVDGAGGGVFTGWARISASGLWQAVVNDSTFGSTLAHVAGRWYRVRHESAGTPTIYYDYSTDGINWTNHTSTTTMPTGGNSIKPAFTALFIISGTTQLAIDNVNIPPGPKLDTLTHDMAAADAAKFTTSVSGTGAITYPSGATQAAITSAGLGTANASSYPATGYDFNDSYAVFQVGTVVGAGNSSVNAQAVSVLAPGGQGPSVRITATQAWRYTFALGPVDAITHTAGNWYGFLEDGGTTHWIYSTDGTNWTDWASDSTATLFSSDPMTNARATFGVNSSITPVNQSLQIREFNTVTPSLGSGTPTNLFFAMM